MSVGFDQTGAGATWQIQAPHITPFSSEDTLVVISSQRIKSVAKPGSVASNPRVEGRGGKILVITPVRCHPATALSWSRGGQRLII
jgi:hypothetical protein